MLDRELLVNLYRQMYELTEPECRLTCRCPQSCCSSEYCEMAEQIALDFWTTDTKSLRTNHKQLPYMGPTGCVLDPHLRPLCTLHTCEINAKGVGPNEKWTKRYFELRNQINDLETKLWTNIK